MLAGEHAQAADQRAEQRHADDDRRTRKDVDDGAGDGGGAGGVAAGHAFALAGAVCADGRRAVAIIWKCFF